MYVCQELLNTQAIPWVQVACTYVCTAKNPVASYQGGPKAWDWKTNKCSAEYKSERLLFWGRFLPWTQQTILKIKMESLMLRFHVNKLELITDLTFEKIRKQPHFLNRLVLTEIMWSLFLVLSFKDNNLILMSQVFFSFSIALAPC